MMSNGLQAVYDSNDSNGWSNDDDLIYEGDSGTGDDVELYSVLNDSRLQKRARHDPAIERIAAYRSKKEDWVITKKTTGFADVHHKAFKHIKVTVSQNRVNKAMEKLDPVNINGVLFKNSSCNCTKNCNMTTLNFNDVLQARTKLFGNPDNRYGISSTTLHTHTHTHIPPVWR